MTYRFMQKTTAFLGLSLLGFLAACASPSISIAPPHQQVDRIADLISQELASRGRKTTDSRQMSHTIVRLSETYRVDPLLVLSIIKVESQFRPTVKSYAGAIGLMQVMPIVVRHIGSEVDIHSQNDLYNPDKNILIGLHYFTYLRDKYSNNLLNTLTAYNMGPAALDGRLSHQRLIPTGYYRKVMSCYEQFQRRLIL